MRLTPTAQASAGYVTGVAAVTVGAGWEWGAPWALITGGAITALSCLLLVDTEPEGDR